VLSRGLAPISGGVLLSSWTPQVVAIALSAFITLWYLSRMRLLLRSGRPPGVRAWPRRYLASFAAGLVILVWVSCGFPAVYSRSLFWVWTVQMMSFLLVVPLVLMAGQPIELARRSVGDRAFLVRLVRSSPVRLLSGPLVGPALVPVLSFGLFFGPLAGWSLQSPIVGSLVSAGLLAIGALIALPLVDVRDERSSMAIGAAMAIGLLELLTDAIPGIVLRLQTHLSGTFFAHHAVYAWSPLPLNDQRRAGSILWGLAELLDLPFLILVFARWVRADAHEAAEIDTVLDAERVARTGLSAHPIEIDTPQNDEPWWITDPQLQDRFRSGRRRQS
jgi:putative membrane protein